MFHHVNLEYHQQIATITINRPAKLNALSEGAFLELRQVLRDLLDNQDIRVVVLKGSGKIFCAGGDIDFFTELAQQPPLERSVAAHQYVGLAHEVLELFTLLPVPLLVAVQGAAAGYGLSLCCIADIVIAATGSRFVPAYLGLGVTPDGGLSYNLPRLIGERRASDMLLNNRSIVADQAEQWGLITRIVDFDELDNETLQQAQKLASGPGMATKNTLGLLRNEHHLNELKKSLSAELESFSTCVQAEDFVEGVIAFRDRRQPNFSQ
ncbi:enoyl-CoA hydratase/isomerase family protein [Marinobacter sp.]|uniref:enoyl-CoA hydratase/isomerase family protein n=1 Tax=Marinobacter sp. TaxID=50741 RepID=UPI0035627CA4